MSNKHEKKFILNILIGLLFTSIGIFMILYVSLQKAQHQDDWIFWSAISAIIINTGLLFFGSGIVHKVKADLIRRQRQKSKNDPNAVE